MNPMDYSLCSQTVTVYRKSGEKIFRRVAENCWFSKQESLVQESYGKSKEKKFLLIIPGNDIVLQPGDRIYEGVGPEKVDWERFIPAAVPELVEAGFAKGCYWNGEITHWEAGNRKETL